jgi:RimJ/RimL family protein N-acetyltransferase
MLIQLRPLREEDAYTSIRWRADPDLWVHTLAAGRPAPRIEDELQWIRSVMADQSSIRMAITLDDRYVGNTYLTGLTPNTAEFHIFIGDRECWGRGIARRATELMLAKAWSLDLDSVHLIVHPDNKAARRIYDALGFVVTGQDDRFIRMSLQRPASGQVGRPEC